MSENTQDDRYHGSITIPREMAEKARDLGINRSGLLRRALAREIERIESENEESGHTSNQPSARTGTTQKEGHI